MKNALLSLLACFCVAAHSTEGEWIQLTRGKQANYELNFSNIAAERSTNARVVQMRVTPLAPYFREDKVQISYFIEHGIVLCNEKRYIMTGQDHFGVDKKFIDSNIGTAFYVPSGKFGDLVTHLISVSCGVPMPGTTKPELHSV